MCNFTYILSKPTVGMDQNTPSVVSIPHTYFQNFLLTVLRLRPTRMFLFHIHTFKTIAGEHSTQKEELVSIPHTYFQNQVAVFFLSNRLLVSIPHTYFQNPGNCLKRLLMTGVSIPHTYFQNDNNTIASSLHIGSFYSTYILSKPIEHHSLYKPYQRFYSTYILSKLRSRRCV